MRVFAASLALLITVKTAQAFDHKTVAIRAADHVTKGYERFASAAMRLAEAARSLCAEPSPDKLKAAREAFRETVFVWGVVENVNFGPITQAQRRERLFFWPDRKGLGRRQVEKLAASTASDLTAEALVGKSVAVQGLTAFDVMAFGDRSDELATTSGAARCAYVRAVARNVANIADELWKGWLDPGGYRKVWLEPGGGNPSFLNETETTRALVRAFLDGLEQTRDLRLAGPLGFRDQKMRPIEPPLRDSGLALTLIQGNIEGARGVLECCGFLEPAVVQSPDKPGEETSGVLTAIDGELALAVRSLDMAAAYPRPFENAEAKKILSQVGFPLKNARQTGGAYLSEAAGVGIGFNAGDGD